ncbi:ComF family protein [Tahibacter amnicola]|uniref:ComF family protein n=1 Tax=Tahibacter amnicola TaxID=2976241 RepID=A0ABY6BDQ6_9GAMM|nr:ComF family protein [Tahibacter amnicola]UXI68166.1 ComF family protein [Tahibacter amnicola]
MKGIAWVDGLRRWGFRWLPSRCVLCGDRGAPSQDLCTGCRRDFTPNHRACTRCAIPLESGNGVCGPCLKRPPPYDAAWAPFVYAAPLDQLLTRFKFSGDLACGRVLAETMAAVPPGDRPEALVPVPLHRQRLRERGFNQSLELARHLGQTLGIPVLAGGLDRIRETPAQAGLAALARRRNLRGAFAPAAGLRWPAHVALVDDVMTTGSTLAACAGALRTAGVARVSAWALARAPRSGGPAPVPSPD